jgi:hypothetical protein
LTRIKVILLADTLSLAGTIWQFGRLDRVAKHFEQGINSYRVPEDLEQVMRILVGALKDTA